MYHYQTRALPFKCTRSYVEHERLHSTISIWVNDSNTEKTRRKCSQIYNQPVIEAIKLYIDTHPSNQ